MKVIDLLKQASLADRMGNYKLADNLFQKVVRIAGGINIVEAELLKLIEKLALTEADKEAIKAGTGSLAKGFEKGGAEYLSQILEKRALNSLGSQEATKEFLRSVGIIEEDVLNTILKDMEKMTPEAQKELLKSKIGLEVARIRNGYPAKTLIQKIFNREKASAAFAMLSPVIDATLKNPNGWLRITSWLTSAGIVWELTNQGIKFFDKVTGLEIPNASVIDKIVNAFKSQGPESTAPGSTSPSGPTGSDEAGGEGSGEAGSGVYQDPTTAPGFNYKSKEDMYERRMKAKLPGGKFQQTLQGEKAQKFVDENKTKYKTQREFLDAAKAAGDANFANSVIALVKKDLDLPVSAEDPRKF